MTEQAAPQGDMQTTEPVDQTSAPEQTTPETEAVAEGVASEAAPETTAELAEAVEEAIEDGATEAEVKEMIREFELKVNGKKKKVKIDLNNEEELIRRLQMAEAGQSAMQQKAEYEKMLQQAVNEWRENPEAFFSEFGVDPDDWAEQRIAKKVEELQKDPRDLEREQLQREVEKYRAELKRQEQEAQQIKMQQLQQQAAMDLENQIVEALDKNNNLPKTRKTVGRIADAMLYVMENGHENVTVDEVLPHVENDIKEEVNELLSAMPIEVLKNWLSKDIFEKMRKDRLASVKKTQSIEKSTPEVTKPTEKEQGTRLNPKRKSTNAKDFFRNLK